MHSETNDAGQGPEPGREGGGFLVVVALLVFSFLQARDLFLGWGSTPMDALSWVAFAVWLLPVLFLWQPGHQDGGGLAAGLVCTLLGVFGFGQEWICLGLAATIAGLLPFSIGKFAWLVAAAGWMPALGAVAGGGPPGALIWARAGIVLMGLVVYAWTMLLTETLTEQRA